MGSNDREYAPSAPLPDWLKGFADKQLKSSSPFDDIKEIFRGKNKHKEAKEAVEAKVEELCDRVGLNMIEKQASLKSESAAGYVGPIEEQTEKNKSFRKVLFTGKHAQLVLMTLQGGEEIGEEVHKTVDQFFRVEEGEATFVLNGTKKSVKEDEAIIVPGGTKHNVINASKTKPLKMYTIYSPPNHPDGTIHKTKEDAEEAEVKADLIEDLIVLANKLEDEGKFKAAILIDSRIRKLADEIILEELTRMPIMPVEMWSDLQLAQVVKNPGLATSPEEKAKWEKAKATFETRVKEKAKRVGLRPTDIGEWGVERGWFLLTWGHEPMGFFNSKSQAELTKAQLVREFAETGEFPEAFPYKKSEIRQRIDDEAYYWIDIGTDSRKIREYTNKEVENILRPDRNNKARKEYAEKAMGVYKAPDGFEPVPDAQVKGAKPTRQTARKAYENIDASPEEFLDVFDDALSEQHAGEADAQGEFVEDAAQRVAKKVDYERHKGKKWDPSEMADDVRLSSRDVGFQLSKRAIKWYTPRETAPVAGPWRSHKLPPRAGTMLQPKSPFPTVEEYEARKERERFEEPEPEPTPMEEKPTLEEVHGENSYWLLGVGGVPINIYSEDLDALGDFGELKRAFMVETSRGPDIVYEILFSTPATRGKGLEFAAKMENLRDNYDFRGIRGNIANIAVWVKPFNTKEPIDPELLDKDVKDLEDYKWASHREKLSEVLPKHVIERMRERELEIRDLLQNIKDWGLGKFEDVYGITDLSDEEADDGQMANDGDGDEKSVFEKHPGIKKHIKNVCESREGHVDTPALMQMIKSRPENLTDKELEEIKEYVKEQIKENKPEAKPSKDDDVIGRGSEEVDMNDDQNAEVFSMPAKV